MKKLESFFDSEAYRQRAAEALDELTDDEIKNWLEHPCTRAVRLTMQGDYMDYHANWEGGTFTDQSAEGTAQKNAKALGGLEAIRLVAEYMENMLYDKG